MIQSRKKPSGFPDGFCFSQTMACTEVSGCHRAPTRLDPSKEPGHSHMARQGGRWRYCRPGRILTPYPEALPQRPAFRVCFLPGDGHAVSLQACLQKGSFIGSQPPELDVETIGEGAGGRLQSEQIVRGHLEQPAEAGKHPKIRFVHVVLVLGDGRLGDSENVGQLLLRPSSNKPQLPEPASDSRLRSGDGVVRLGHGAIIPPIEKRRPGDGRSFFYCTGERARLRLHAWMKRLASMRQHSHLGRQLADSSQTARRQLAGNSQAESRRLPDWALRQLSSHDVPTAAGRIGLACGCYFPPSPGRLGEGHQPIGSMHMASTNSGSSSASARK
ncbi:hypothetical protein BN871_HS_00050 [Paenibacillus sp. P22]|nr:hypothetical protein BN871_HS_00050 [Paenibacillus sp. P22]